MTMPVDPAVVAGLAGAAGGLANDAKKALGGVVQGVPGVSELGDLTDTARAVRAWIGNRHNWVRVAWFLSGAALFTVGAVMVAERPISNATNSVVQPVGRVVKSAYKG